MKEARKFLEWNKIENYTINPDGTVGVKEYAIILTIQSKFPVKFEKINGYFDCDNTNLVSLEEVPSSVNGYFSCSHNQLTSLHDVHKHIKEVNGWFYCRENPIKDSVLGLLMIKGIRGISLENRKVQAILNKHIRDGRAGVISAQQELLDAGLDEYARL